MASRRAGEVCYRPVAWSSISGISILASRTGDKDKIGTIGLKLPIEFVDKHPPLPGTSSYNGNGACSPDGLDVG